MMLIMKHPNLCSSFSIVSLKALLRLTNCVNCMYNLKLCLLSKSYQPSYILISLAITILELHGSKRTSKKIIVGRS